MIVENGKIVIATEEELFEHYLKAGFDDLMSFPDYKSKCIKFGTKVICEEGADNDR